MTETGAARRVVVDAAVIDAVVAGAPLPSDAAHHLVKVLRLDDGAPVEIGDGAGRVFLGHLAVAGRRATLRDARAVAIEARPEGPILLAALIKPQRWRIVVEKAVELGASDLYPVISERVTTRPSLTQSDKLSSKWASWVREAGQQCRRPRLTRLHPPQALEALLGAIRDDPGREDRSAWPSLRRLASTRLGAESWPSESRGRAVLLVGPEGGFSEAEERQAVSAGFVATTLGPFPVRAETAAMAMLTLASDRHREDPECP